MRKRVYWVLPTPIFVYSFLPLGWNSVVWGLVMLLGFSATTFQALGKPKRNKTRAVRTTYHVGKKRKKKKKPQIKAKQSLWRIFVFCLVVGLLLVVTKIATYYQRKGANAGGNFEGSYSPKVRSIIQRMNFILKTKILDIEYPSHDALSFMSHANLHQDTMKALLAYRKRWDSLGALHEGDQVTDEQRAAFLEQDTHEQYYYQVTLALMEKICYNRFDEQIGACVHGACV